MYIGTIPTPAATESRQEFTCTAGQTTFTTTGGTTGYIDCFLNGVKLDSRSDFTFDGSVVTLTTGAAANDILAVIMRQADNALVALPIKDSAGNNVLSEANNVVSIGNGVQFPAGHVIGYAFDSNRSTFNITGTYATNATPTTSGGGEIFSVPYTCKKSTSKLLFHITPWIQESSNHSDKIACAIFRDSTFLAVQFISCTGYPAAEGHMGWVTSIMQVDAIDEISHNYNIRVGADGGTLEHFPATASYWTNTYYNSLVVGSTFELFEISN